MTAGSRARVGAWMPLWPVAVAALLGGWMVVSALWPHWSLNPQYQYGQIVPALCLALFYLRWQDRPAMAPASRPGGLFSVIIAAMAVLAIVAVRPILESNAEWRVPAAVSAFAGVALLLAAIYLAGGAAWLRHFSFPALFFLVAVPWPSGFETRLMNSLMNGNAQACVEALQWMGFEAGQRGNLIALPSGVLEVEEACSGVRSLQSGIMVSLLFGEFFRLRAGGRILLVVLAFGAALAGNAARTLTLASASTQGGARAVEAWHDPAGFAVLLSTIAVVGLAGRLLSRRRKIGPSSTPSAASGSLAARLAGWRPAAFSLCAVWIFAIVGTEAWYRAHDHTELRPENAWTFRETAPNQGVQAVEIPPATYRLLLKPDTAFSEQWSDADGLNWRVFYFRWGAGHTAVELAMTVHDPRVCLRLMGMDLRETFAPGFIEAAGFRIPFRKFLFYDGKNALYVFHAVVKDQAEDRIPFADDGDYAAIDRLRYVLAGQRNHGLKVLEFAIWGASSLPDAERRLQAVLEKRLKPADEARNVEKLENRPRSE